MANDLSKNVSTKLLKKFGPMFMSDLVLGKMVDTSKIAGEFDGASGETIYLKRPHQYQAIESSDGDISGSSSSNIIAARSAATVQNMISVKVDWNQVVQAFYSDQWEQVLKPMSDTVTTRLESMLATFMLKNSAHCLGTAGTAIDAWADIAQAGTFMKDLGYTGPVHAAIDPWSAQNLADLQKGLYTSDDLVRDAFTRARIAREFGGVNAYLSNALNTYTAGTADGGDMLVAVKTTPTVTYSALKDSYQLTVVLKNCGNALTVTAGQQLQFNATYLLNQQNKNVMLKNGTAVPFVGTVMTTATSDAGGDMTVTISGAPIYDATNPQYNTVSRAIVADDVVKILGTISTTYKPSLFFAKEAFSMTTISLKPLSGWDSSVVNWQGFSIRSTRSSDPDTGLETLRLDLWPAFACNNPLLAGHLAGN